MSKARELANLGNAYSDGALSNRNLIINGAMQVAQRGTSSASSGMHSVDRFACDFAGPAITQSKVAITSGGAFDDGFRSAFKTEVTSAAATGGTYALLYQNIEAQNVANSGWDCTNPASSITLSFWVRSSISGTFYTDIRTNDGTAYGYTESFVLSANAWTKVTQTISGNSSLTVADDNGIGLFVGVSPYFGTNLTDPSRAEGWAALGGFTSLTPDYAQNWCGTNGNTFEITGVQLEVGDQATPFEHRSYGDELARCQRYCQVVETLSVGNQSFGAFSNWNNVSSYGGYAYVQRMRASPSSAVSGGLGTFYNFGGATTNVTAVNPQNMGVDLLEFNISHGSLPQACSWWRLDTNFKMTLDAEL